SSRVSWLKLIGVPVCCGKRQDTSMSPSAEGSQALHFIFESAIPAKLEEACISFVTETSEQSESILASISSRAENTKISGFSCHQGKRQIPTLSSLLSIKIADEQL
ncbi:MAG: hypothetical protein KME03_11795, partial [Aphanocapsa lilacina HA4352-LM1]|nr:hypothetical protein [Aphanocapsa lilacina HA4352-LM1]